MDWFSGVVVFVLVWWLVLFAVLPWGIRHIEEPDIKEHAAGAPVTPDLKKKFIITTFVSVAIWVIIFVLIKIGVIDFYGIARMMMEEDRNR